jgi:hypothetical protein
MIKNNVRYTENFNRIVNTQNNLDARKINMAINMATKPVSTKIKPKNKEITKTQNFLIFWGDFVYDENNKRNITK